MPLICGNHSSQSDQPHIIVLIIIIILVIIVPMIIVMVIISIIILLVSLRNQTNHTHPEIFQLLFNIQ